jgi:6-pyruvoyltetrahydropterin/6-carboxytetrahydropterin synthase
MKIISRVFGFDAGHRVIDHPGKCKDFHGHRYYGETHIAFKDEQEIGYAIDFGDIKKLVNGAFDYFFDHGMILNPADRAKTYLAEEGKVYTLSYYGDDVFRNPTAENIATEMLCMMEILLEDMDGLTPASIVLYETPNCSVTYGIDDLTLTDINGFEYHKGSEVREWRDNILTDLFI